VGVGEERWRDRRDAGAVYRFTAELAGVTESYLSRIERNERVVNSRADLGRGMAQERSTRDAAVGALLRAEKIAPNCILPNPFVRETIAVDTHQRGRSGAGVGSPEIVALLAQRFHFQSRR
jgi:transcriptional regulator with XRE-family HTH domain